MKRKLFALVLAFALVFSTLTVFAGQNDETDYYVIGNNVGTAANALSVSGGSDGIKYVSLGDSMAYGYGLDGTGETFKWSSENQSMDNSYPVLISEYLNRKDFSTSGDFFGGAVCGERVVDLCYMLTENENIYPKDAYHTASFVSTYFAGDVAEDKSITYNMYKSKLKEAITDADFISITAGGNDLLSYTLLALMYYHNEDLSYYYGKIAAQTYEAMKQMIIKQAEKTDFDGSKGTKDKLTKIFGLIDIMLYTMGGYAKGEAGVLDIIHEMNPHAVIAITGLPLVLNEYKFVIDEIEVDLESVFTPMTKLLNDIIKNAAQERSSYVRYIDISDTEVFDMPGFTVDPEDGKKVISSLAFDAKTFLPSLITITHPSAEGHQYIANQVMKNFKFQKEGGTFTTVKNELTNFAATFMSRIGITKITNMVSTFMNIDFAGFVSNTFKFFKLLSGSSLGSLISS